MAYKGASLAEIESKLRQDFARRLKEHGHASTETNDPILRILFRTFAGQLESLYSDTDRIREALLDELISGLGIERRMPRPAQTIIRFFEQSANELVPAGTELVGVTQSKARLTFVTDATIAVSPARVAMAASYQNEKLQLLPGTEMPDAMQAGYPSPDAVPLRLGPAPAIFIAVENLPSEHLSRHGVFLDIGDADLQRSIRREIWRMADSDGKFAATGILRPHRRNAGVQELRWLLDEDESSNGGDAGAGEIERPELPDGFYAGRMFVFPEVPRSRRQFVCRYPRGLDQGLSKIFRDFGALFAEPRAWIRISIPPATADLNTAVHSVALHAISASNIVDLNQTVQFGAQGTSIPVEQAERYLVAPVAITGGDDNAEYIPAFQSSSEPGVGRYSIRNGRIDLIPSTRSGNANIPTWVTSGAHGNTVAPGDIQTFVRPADRPTLRISNPMPAAGGTNGESFSDAHARFAHVLLARSRVVTGADLHAAVTSLDRRIKRVEVEAALQRFSDGLHRILRVTATVDRNEFQDPDEEMRILQEDTERYLRNRVPFGTELNVECRWAEEEAAR
jgi:hypothetical protein